MAEAAIRPEMGLSYAAEAWDTGAIRCGDDWQTQVRATGAPEDTSGGSPLVHRALLVGLLSGTSLTCSGEG